MLKRNTHFYLFCDPETMFVAKPLAEQAGFKFWKPLIWDKKRIGMGYHYRAMYECILFFEKGKRKLNDLGISDIIEAAADQRRLSGGEAAAGERGADRAEHAARRAGDRSVHGLGLGGGRGDRARPQLHGATISARRP